MKILPLVLAAVTSVVLGASVAPASAAATATGPAFCSTSADHPDQQRIAKQQLFDQLQLGTKQGATIDEWNGCLKVMYTDASGHTTVALYDPDSLTLVSTLG